MTENKRLIEIQKALNFSSQEKFASALGIKQGSLSDIYREKGGIGVSDSIKRILNKDYSINIEWIEEGKGEMFQEQQHKGSVVSSPDIIAIPREALELMKAQQRTIEIQQENINRALKLSEEIILSQKETIELLAKKGEFADSAKVAVG